MVKSESREKLIGDNLRLVNHLCKRFCGRGIEYEDLYQAGCVGLVKAADNFDESLGYRFSTYAVPVILGEMRRLFRDGGSLKVSRSIKELSLKINKVRAQLEYELGHEPTVSLIAKRLGVSPQEVSEALDAAQPALSLTAVSDDGERQFDLPTVSFDGVDNRILLDTAIAKLSPDEQTVVRLRFFEQLTQSETANRLCMTQVGVSRAEKKILKKLRTIIGAAP